MIELPEGTVPGNASHIKADTGFEQRNMHGQILARINRPERGYKLAMSYGPYSPEVARVMVSRLLAAKKAGLRIPYPLQIDQGNAGSPVVDGADQEGTTLVMRGLTPGYTCRDGYWLSIKDDDGRYYLYNVLTGGVADGAGDLTIVLNEGLQHPHLDGDEIQLTKPMIEGSVIGDETAWETSVNRATPINFILEERG